MAWHSSRLSTTWKGRSTLLAWELEQLSWSEDWERCFWATGDSMARSMAEKLSVILFNNRIEYTPLKQWVDKLSTGVYGCLSAGCCFRSAFDGSLLQCNWFIVVMRLRCSPYNLRRDVPTFISVLQGSGFYWKGISQEAAWISLGFIGRPPYTVWNLIGMFQSTWQAIVCLTFILEVKINASQA